MDVALHMTYAYLDATTASLYNPRVQTLEIWSWNRSRDFWGKFGRQKVWDVLEGTDRIQHRSGRSENTFCLSEAPRLVGITYVPVQAH